MEISAAIMAHPNRKDWAEELHQAIPFAEIVWDRMNLEWDTGRRAILAGVDAKSDWHLVVQDDAILCKDFVPGIQAALVHAPEGPVSFYTGAPRPYPREIAHAVEKTLELDRCWLSMRGPIWGVCVAFPTKTVGDLVYWCDTTEDGNYDSKIAEFFKKRDINCHYTIPSLADHRWGPSLLGHGQGVDVRRARVSIGDSSALDIDWGKGVFNAGDPSEPWQQVDEARFICPTCVTIFDSLAEVIIHACQEHDYGPFDLLAGTPGAIKQMDELYAALPEDMRGTLWIVRKDFAKYSTTSPQNVRAVRKPEMKRELWQAPWNFIITDVAFNFQYIGDRTGWSFQGFSN